MQLNMLEAMNIYVNVVEQGSFIRAAEVFPARNRRKAACALTSLLRSPGQSSFRLLEIFRTDTRILRLYLVRPIARLI